MGSYGSGFGKSSTKACERARRNDLRNNHQIHYARLERGFRISAWYLFERRPEIYAAYRISIMASTFGIGIPFRSAEAPRMFSIATRIGAPLTSH